MFAGFNGLSFKFWFLVLYIFSLNYFMFFRENMKCGAVQKAFDIQLEALGLAKLGGNDDIRVYKIAQIARVQPKFGTGASQFTATWTKYTFVWSFTPYFGTQYETFYAFERGRRIGPMVSECKRHSTSH